MAPSSRAWIRNRMATIRKNASMAFSEDIFLSILICLVSQHKHLVLNTTPELATELKSLAEQHCTLVCGLTTAIVTCHPRQTRADILDAMVGRFNDLNLQTASTSGQYNLGGGSGVGGGSSNTGGGGGNNDSVTNSNTLSNANPGSSPAAMNNSGGGNALSGGNSNSNSNQQQNYAQHYQYIHPGDEYMQRLATNRTSKSRRSIATNYSGVSEDSGRFVGENTQQQQQQQQFQQHQGGTSTGYSSGRRPTYLMGAPQYPGQGSSLTPTQSNIGGGNSAANGGPVTPIDSMFPRRRNESMSAHGYGAISGGSGIGGEMTGVTYSSRRLAQVLILDNLENASQEVFAVLLEIIIKREIVERNRFLFTDALIIAVFRAPTVPSNIPKQLLDYFTINYQYASSIPKPKNPPPLRRNPHFRKSEWEELTKRVRAVSISTDMHRYIRDVIVGIRTHVNVEGGLTPRGSQDLYDVLKTLAVIFQMTFVTPDLVMIATEKVFSHRLQMQVSRRYLQQVQQLQLKRQLQETMRQQQNDSVSVPNLLSSSSNIPLQSHQQYTAHKAESVDSSLVSSSSSDAGSFIQRESSTDDEDNQSHNRRKGDGAGAGVRASGSMVNIVDPQEDDIEPDKSAAEAIREVLRIVYPPI